MSRIVSATVFAIAVLLTPVPAAAHCDAVDGPVVKAAAEALQKGDLTPVLRWVAREQEAEMRAAFADARAVRAGGARALALADRYFLETVVRLHRQSEGEPYTGLKPAGGIGEHLVEGDRALDSGTIDRLADALARSTTATLRARFAEALERRAHAGDSVDAGRRYVAAYVAFMHYVEEVGSLGEAGGRDPHR